MNRRNFLAGMMALFAGALAAKASDARGNKRLPIEDGADELSAGVDAESPYMETGTLAGMTYMTTCRNGEYVTHYVLTDGTVGFARCAPQAIVHVYEGGS